MSDENEKLLGKDFVFAQKLVGNEQDEREEALSQTFEWLKKRETLNENQCYLLWDVLYQSLWMCDRYLTQHDYCDKLIQIIDIIKEKDFKEDFINTYIKYFCEKWGTLDKWRVEKFLVLSRKFIERLISLYKEENNPIKIIDLLKFALKQSNGNGFKNHMIDIVSDNLPMLIALDKDKFYDYLELFFKIYSEEHNNPSLVKHVDLKVVYTLTESLGENFFADDEENSYKCLKQLLSDINSGLKSVDSNIDIHNMRYDKAQELRKIIAALNRKRKDQGKPVEPVTITGKNKDK